MPSGPTSPRPPCTSWGRAHSEPKRERSSSCRPMPGTWQEPRPSAIAPAGAIGRRCPWTISARSPTWRSPASTRFPRSSARRGRLRQRARVELVGIAPRQEIAPDEHGDTEKPVLMEQPVQRLSVAHGLLDGVSPPEAGARLDEESLGPARQAKRAIAIHRMRLERPALELHARIGQSPAGQLGGGTVAALVVEDGPHGESVVGGRRQVKRTGTSWRRRAGSGRSGSRSWRGLLFGRLLPLSPAPSFFLFSGGASGGERPT